MFSLMLQEAAKETKQEQSSKNKQEQSEEPKFQAFTGKKYSLRGWWICKQLSAFKLFCSPSPVRLYLCVRKYNRIMYLSGMYYQKMKDFTFSCKMKEWKEWLVSFVRETFRAGLQLVLAELLNKLNLFPLPSLYSGHWWPKLAVGGDQKVVYLGN